MSDIFFAELVLSALLLATAICLNVMGTYLLWKKERGLTNQRLILMNLSICEAITSALLLGNIVLEFRKLDDKVDKIYGQILFAAIEVLRMEYYCIMCIMTIDRCIGTRLPLKCFILFSKRRAKIVLGATWTLSLLSCALFGIFYQDFSPYFHLFLLALGIASLCCIIVSYCYILTILINSGILRAGTRNRRNCENKQFIKMTAIISSTFVFLILIPEFVHAFLHEKVSIEVKYVIYIMWYIDLVVDPITYILIRKKLRRAFVEVFKWNGSLHDVERTRAIMNTLSTIATVSRVA